VVDAEEILPMSTDLEFYALLGIIALVFVGAVFADLNARERDRKTRTWLRQLEARVNEMELHDEEADL
jgi:hypothetical protein